MIVVDQNADDRVGSAIADAPAQLDIVQLRSPAGCHAPGTSGLLTSRPSSWRFPTTTASTPTACSNASPAGSRLTLGSARSRVAPSTLRVQQPGSGRPRPGQVTLATVWHGGNSASIFLRRSVLTAAGPFDERLGLGSGTPWTSGEEIDYLIRALRTGARVEYDPSLVVTHPLGRSTPDELVAIGARDGASVGYSCASTTTALGWSAGCCSGRHWGARSRSSAVT